LVVETLADWLRRGGSAPSETDERLWVLRLAVKRIVAGRRLRATVEPMLPDDLGLPAAADRAGIERLALNIAMLELPIRDRTMIALEHVADLSLDEIAWVMGIDRVVARSDLDNARNRLFEAVEREPDFIDEL
jgi:DNA-directed RNA polymerase specialized sigma24 family protein